MLLRNEDGLNLSYHGDVVAQTVDYEGWQQFFVRHPALFSEKGAVAIAAPLHEKDLEHVAEAKYAMVVEALDPHDDLSGVLGTAILKEKPALFLSLTTATAFHMPLSYYASATLQKMFSFSEDLRQGMEFCLQEAISNALIHGNLAVHSAQKTGDGESEAFFNAVQNRLVELPWKNRRLTLAARSIHAGLQVMIEDEGDGFDVEKVMNPSKTIDPNKPSGRSAHIIRELTAARHYELGGRRLLLDFSLKA